MASCPGRGSIRTRRHEDRAQTLRPRGARGIGRARHLPERREWILRLLPSVHRRWDRSVDAPNQAERAALVSWSLAPPTATSDCPRRDFIVFGHNALVLPPAPGRRPPRPRFRTFQVCSRTCRPLGGTLSVRQIDHTGHRPAGGLSWLGAAGPKRSHPPRWGRTPQKSESKIRARFDQPHAAEERNFPPK
jgi:hypothetical protein